MMDDVGLLYSGTTRMHKPRQAEPVSSKEYAVDRIRLVKCQSGGTPTV